MSLPFRLPGLVVALVAALLIAPSAASASHIQGGSIDAGINASGHLVGTVTFTTTHFCASVGTPAYEMPSLSLQPPSGPQQWISLSGTFQRCLSSSSTAVGTFDIDLDALLGGPAPDGAYTLTATASARVGGILNAGPSGSTAQYSARVTKRGTTPSYSPHINSAVANAIARNYPFKQNLNGVDPDGTPVTYQSRAGQTGGPATDLVTIGTDGVVSMTAAQTGALSDNAFLSYLVRVVDADGDFSERDVLLRVTGTNVPPAITGLPGAPVQVLAGAGPQTVTFTASDGNGDQTVELAPAGHPAWASLSAPAGNPVQATLTLDPPADAPEGTYAFNLDAVDSHPSVPLFASEPVSVTVIRSVPDTTIGAAPNAYTNARTATFSFSSDTAGATFECRIDEGEWAACASPAAFTVSGEGRHTFAVRAVGGHGQRDATPATHAWTLDTVAPAAPVVIGAPAGTVTATSAQFTWTGEDAGSFECSLDGAAFAPCVSPLALATVAKGTHTFLVRQIDAAGNVGANRSVTWTVADAATPPTGSPRVTAVTGAGASVAVQGNTASVGCRVTGATLAACRVSVYAYDRPTQAGVSVKAGAARKAKLVLIGRGRVTAGARENATRLAVDVKLNATGRRLVAQQLAGLAVVLKVEARTVQGPRLTSRTNARLVPRTQLVVPERGMFATGSAKLTKVGARLVKTLGARLGKVKAVTCVGHTDTVGSAALNARLGLARAKTVCAALKRGGARGRLVVESSGEQRPRATNATAAGRALNRRVEISVRYR